MKGRERGAGLFRAVLWLLLLLFFVYAAFQIVPAYMAEYQLEDGMRSEARFAAVDRRPREQVREDVHHMVTKLGIPATLDDIRVELIEGGFRISVDYTVPVHFFRYQFRLDFHPTAESDSI
jgi:hypothetical protein